MLMTHPVIEGFDGLTRPSDTAAALGYRMPAEFEPLASVWVTRPHNPETWPGCLDEAAAQFDAWVAAMSQVVPVSMTDELGVATNDSWIRDFGPIFVVCNTPFSREAPPVRSASAARQGEEETRLAAKPPRCGAREEEVQSSDIRHQTSDIRHSSPLALHDFRFNGWGGKYELRDLDDVVPQYIAEYLHLPLWVHDFVFEGGSIDVNGRGAALTTEQCLLNPNRNPNLTRADIEMTLAETLGITQLIWLPGGIVGDDTDGHIDDIARFVAPNRIVASVAPPELADHPDHAMLQANLEALKAARDADGQPFDVVELPVPEVLYYDFPADRFGPGGRGPVPASYANFLIANGSVFLPVFGQANDDLAARALERAMPGYRIVPLRADRLVVGLGGFHCLSQQQPVG